ncbi:MAG TPA: NUDIX domain-containing protein [Patescibacteria group bacterium]|nr:NUDIX domain-containing protein [Patescibacteria group bacterium]
MENVIKQTGKDWYFVAMKVFMTDKNGRLLILKDKFKCWDLPGGRLKYDEFEKSLEKVVMRKMKEELGAGVKYKLGQPVVFMRHERMENLADGGKEKVRIFAVGFEAKYLGGKIDLGKNHLEYKFAELKGFKPEKYFKGGWLKGVKEYIKTLKHENIKA